MNIVPLRHLAQIWNSNVDKLTAPDEVPVRLCNYVDVYKNDRITADMEFMIASATHSEIAKFGLRVGDVIITKDSEERTDIAVPAFVASTAPDLVCGYHLALIRAQQGRMCGNFLFWALQSKPSKESFGNAAGGVTRFGLTLDGMKSVRLPCPDLETQKAIADFLDRETARIDQLIEKKQRLVGLLDEKTRRAVSSTFEQLASGYPIWRLKHVLISGLAYGANEAADSDDPNDVRYIRITDIDADGCLRSDTFKSLPREKISGYLLEDGDILLARSGATVGKSFIYRDFMGECCYAGYLIRARVNQRLVSPDFIHQFTSTDQYRNHILGNNIQATIQNVSAEKYANLAFPLPPRDQQDVITNEIAQRNIRIAAAKRSVSTSIDCLREYRAALITAAVTGQIDVTAWVRKGTPDARLDAIEAEMAQGAKGLKEARA